MRAKRALPTFIGIGGKKCATTWLSECLRDHPQIFMSSPKELNFFDGNGSLKDIGAYLSHFARSGEYEAAGEFSSTYLTNPHVAKEIRGCMGQVKIIASIRNPIDRFVSECKELIRRGVVAEQNADGGNSIIIGRPLVDRIHQQWPTVISNGQYFEGLNRYIEVFGRESVHTIIKEELDLDAEQELGRLYRFLGVSSTHKPAMLKRLVSPSIVPRHAWLEDWRHQTFLYCHQQAPSIINWYKRLGIASIYRWLNADTSAAIRIDVDALEQIIQFYRNDVAGVQQLLGRDIPAWRSINANHV
ncbi:MAG: sulfotransferase domain-containing protein [Nitrococcus sp.]|nr:sulfotransferase domain-containing protein [Nitrococcus sp.]